MAFDVLDFLRGRGLLSGAESITVTPLTGGFWNDNFRVRGPGFDWVVKCYRSGQRASLFPVLPDAEALALRVLSGREVAPEPVAYFADGGPVLVYAFWPGDVWREGVVPVAHLLRRLHRVPVDGTEGFRLLPVEPVDILGEGDAMLERVPGDGLAAGCFAFARPPFDERRCLLDPDGLAARDVRELLRLEDGAMKAGLAWLRERLAEGVSIIFDFYTGDPPGRPSIDS